MKKVFPILLFALAVCCGCTSTYRLTQTDGSILLAHGKPKYNAQDGRYYYKDLDGQVRFVYAAKVREIAPASIRDKNGSQFSNGK